MSLLSVLAAIRSAKSVEDEYFCTNCGAILNDQSGFDPEEGRWVCTECHTHLYDGKYEGDFYKDIVWYCDKCGAFLNKQEGFTEMGTTWKCTECGYDNSITEEDIYIPAKRK